MLQKRPNHCLLHTLLRGEPLNHDGVIDIHYCGICPSDIHQVRDEWGGNSKFPIVFGHEIIGKVFKIGPKVTRFKKYDSVGMGCMVDSCRYCDEFAKGLEQHVLVVVLLTYYHEQVIQGIKTPTQGGYSNRMIVNEYFTS